MCNNVQKCKIGKIDDSWKQCANLKIFQYTPRTPSLLNSRQDHPDDDSESRWALSSFEKPGIPSPCRDSNGSPPPCWQAAVKAWGKRKTYHHGMIATSNQKVITIASRTSSWPQHLDSEFTFTQWRKKDRELWQACQWPGMPVSRWSERQLASEYRLGRVQRSRRRVHRHRDGGPGHVGSR